MRIFTVANPDQVDKLVAADGASGDNFGFTLSIDGDTLIVGSPLDDDKGSNSGAAYIYTRQGDGSWLQSAKLTASDGASGDEFGRFVSVRGDIAVVAAPRDGARDNGSAYVFARQSNGTWSQVTRLVAGDGANYDEFGSAIAIDNDTIVIGAYRDDDGGSESGSAYVYTRQGDGSWLQSAKLTASDAAAGDQLSRRSISISGDVIIVGAAQNDDAGTDSGSAYIFQRQSNGTWLQSAKLTASDAAAGDQFGLTVSISGDTALVGARQDDDGGTDSGSAYIFQRQSDGTWLQTAKLIAADGASGDNFGYAVTLRGDTAVVGAYNDDTGGSDGGSAYIFQRQVDGSWTQTRKLIAPDTAATDWFGYSVSLDDDSVAVGAYLDDDAGANSGSVYLYSLNPQGSSPPINLFPDAEADAIVVTANSSLNVVDVLANDVSFGNGLSFVKADLTSTNGGTVRVDDRGTANPTDDVLLYTPASGFSGTDTFSYTITDIDGSSDIATVTITVNPNIPVDVLPLATADNATVQINSLNNVINVLSNEASFGDGLRSLVADAISANGGLVSVDDQGTADPTDDVLLYTPAAGFSGVDTFSYTITDIDGDIAIAAVTVNVASEVSSGPSISKILAADGKPEAWFGNSVFIDDKTAIVGSFRDGSGSAFIFSQQLDGTWSQTAKLTPASGRSGDDFGRSVAIYGNTAIIGSPGDDNGYSNAGSAYIFTRQADNSWVETAILSASDRADADEFGNAVSIDGDTALIGSFGDDDAGQDSGAAYVFRRQTDGSWTQAAKLVATDAASGDLMGRRSISISGDLAVVGAYGNGSGSAYIFTRQASGTWLQTAKLTPADGGNGDEFGRNVTIDNNTVVIGAQNHDATGADSGAAYVFNRLGDGTWTQTAKLTAADAASGDRFGYAVSLKDNTLVVGAYNDDANGIDSGSAYIFQRQTNGTWSQVRQLIAPDGAATDWFGYAVSTDGTNAMVGAFRDDDAGAQSGSAYIFALDFNDPNLVSPALLSTTTDTLIKVDGDTTNNVEVTVNSSSFSTHPDDLIRINVGGGDFTDVSGNLWVADYGFQGGTTHYAAQEIANTDNDELFYAKRYGDNFSYEIVLANGTYDVVLHMMEPNSNAQVGSRVFDVFAEDTLRLNDFDMYTAMGTTAAPRTAVTATILDVSVTDNNLNLSFLTVAGRPANIAGIEIMRS